uniref:Uncharacterized protein n=1 Tax=Catagonus wagneri TaxID=51154 RepID=A0A8C3YL12_9CETA
MVNEKPKEGVKTENKAHINLKVAGQNGFVVQFKIKSKLTKSYYTPAQLKMEVEDTIDVCQQQMGGVY